MFKKKRVGKPQKSLKLNSNNHYICLIPQDALYRHSLHLLKSPEFKASMLKITQDFNLLLHMNQKQFWRQLDQNLTLTIALESCLSVFPRRIYEEYEDGQMGIINEKDEVLKIVSILMKTVMFVYYRISQLPNDFACQILYNRWLLDVPKLLELTAIYGESNPKIVTNLINNIFKIIPDFDQQVLDFFTSLQNHPLLLGQQACLSIDFSRQSLTKKYFNNRQKYIFQEVSKELFRVKDLLTSLISFMKLFPDNYGYELIVDCKIQEKMLRAIVGFLKVSGEDWKMEGHQKYFEKHFEDIRQTFATYLIMVLKKLREVLEGKNEDLTKRFIKLALNTYETLCLYFSCTKSQVQSVYLRKILTYLLEQTQQNIFFIPICSIKVGSKAIKKDVKRCVEYEKNYRKQMSLSVNKTKYDETYQSFRSSIFRFKCLCVRQEEQKKLAEKLIKQPQIGKLLLDIYQLKYCKMSVEYDDEPEEFEHFFRDKPSVFSQNLMVTDMTIEKPAKKSKRHNSSSQRNKTNDSKLSVWSISQFNESQMHDQTNNSEKTSGFMIKHTHRYELSRQEINGSVSNSWQKGIEKQQIVDLSFFQIDQSNNNFSFSLVSQVKPNQANVFPETAENQENTQLMNMIADIGNQKSSFLQPIQGEKAQFEQYQWEQKIQALSFDMSAFET